MGVVLFPLWGGGPEPDSIPAAVPRSRRRSRNLTYKQQENQTLKCESQWPCGRFMLRTRTLLGMFFILFEQFISLTNFVYT